MATQAEMDGLASKLVTCGTLSWLVSDCPVVALFKNKVSQELDSLGQPLNRNACGDMLRLWIGINQDTRELFVTLTMRIRLSPVRKKTRRQGRLMFLIVPAESLRLNTAPVAYKDLGDKLPQRLLDMPNDVASTKCQLLHMSLHLGSATSHVVMPAYQCRPNVMSQAMMLLRRLKSLSEASSFHLYSNHNTAMQVALEVVSAMLSKKEPIITPTVVTRAFYPGGRSACINLWADQGWLEESGQTNQTESGTASANQKETINPSDPQPPPPYEPGTVTPPVFSPPGQDEAPFLPSTAVFPSEPGTTELPQIAPLHASSPRNDNLPNDCQELAHHRANAATSVEASQIFAPLPRPSPSTPEPSLSSNYTATFLSGFSSMSPLHGIRNAMEAQRKAITREGSCLSVQVAASICDRAFFDNNISTRANTPGENDRVPDSLTRKRLPSYSSEEGARDVAKRLATAGSNSRPHLLNGLNVEMSPTIANTVSCQDGQSNQEVANNEVSIVEGNQLSRWLTLAWDHCPTAHYLFINELLRYGAAASSNQPDEIASCHVHCTLALLEHFTEENLAASFITTAEKKCNVSVETKELLHWLYNLRPGADMEVFPFLLQMSILERRISCQSTEEESATLMGSYKRLKADVVSQACTQFAQEVLRDADDVSQRMSREKTRLGL